MEFRQLTEKDQVREIEELSNIARGGVLIFKHSTRCAISTMALNRFTRAWDVGDEHLPVYYLDLIRFRELSDLVAEKFEVTHQSPQVLLIRNGKCVYHASHNAISPSRVIEEAEYA
mgnify:CR=1 FL=1